MRSKGAIRAPPPSDPRGSGLEIIAWSAKHDPKTAADPAFVRRLRSDRDGLEREIRSQLLARIGKDPARGHRAARPQAARTTNGRATTRRRGMNP